MFKIAKNDTIRATATSEEGKFLAAIYDSQFTTIGEITSKLLSKIPYTNTRKVFIHIVNLDKDKSKDIKVNVNN